MVALVQFPEVPVEQWTILRLRMADLVMDRYQRPLELARVKDIARNFKPELCDPLVVNRRPDGSYACIDGQHRGHGLIAGFGSDVTWLCRVTEGLSYEEEARLFFELNQNRRQVSVVDRFWAAVEAADPEALQVKEIVERHGFGLISRTRTGDPEHGTITALGALLHVFRKYRDGSLNQTLELIADVHGTRPAPSNGLIRGVSSVLSEYAEIIDRKRLETVMRRLTPARIEAEAEDMRRVLRVLSEVAVRHVLVNHYNRSLPEKKRLPERGVRG